MCQWQFLNFDKNSMFMQDVVNFWNLGEWYLETLYLCNLSLNLKALVKPFNAVGSEEGDANDSGEEKHVSEEVLRQEQDQPGPTWWGRGRGPGTGGAGHGKRSTCLLLLPLPRLRTAAR